MNNVDSEQTQYDGVNASPYDNPEYKTEMAFRYKNYNPETNSFHVDLYTGLGKTKTKELQPNEWDHFDDKEQYERTNHTQKEKWIIKKAIEVIKSYKGYPKKFKNYTGINKLKYEDVDFDETEAWINHEDGIVNIRLYFDGSNIAILESFSYSNLEEEYYEYIENKFSYIMELFKEDVVYYLEGYADDYKDDFVEYFKDCENDWVDIDEDTVLNHFIEEIISPEVCIQIKNRIDQNWRDLL